MHGLPGHPETLGDLGYRDAIKDLQNGPVSLLDHVQLPKHERERHKSSGATVSHIKRSRAQAADLGVSQFGWQRVGLLQAGLPTHVRHFAVPTPAVARRPARREVSLGSSSKVVGGASKIARFGVAVVWRWGVGGAYRVGACPAGGLVAGGGQAEGLASPAW